MGISELRTKVGDISSILSHNPNIELQSKSCSREVDIMHIDPNWSFKILETKNYLNVEVWSKMNPNKQMIVRIST